MKIKFPVSKNINQIKKFFRQRQLNYLIKKSEIKNKPNPSLKKTKIPYKPELFDLYMLYKYVVLNKRTTILEFSSGWSSLIFVKTLNELKKKFSKDVKKLRRQNPFELFI